VPAVEIAALGGFLLVLRAAQARRPWKISGMVAALRTVKVVDASMDMLTPPCSPNS